MVRVYECMSSRATKHAGTLIVLLFDAASFVLKAIWRPCRSRRWLVACQPLTGQWSTPFGIRHLETGVKAAACSITRWPLLALFLSSQTRSPSSRIKWSGSFAIASDLPVGV